MPVDLSSLKIEYPELPVVEHREEFFEMLEKHQVVIVKADTGSGKSTQLPKFLLEWFAGKQGDKAGFKIGVTEPRRLAAISIADRLREELKDENARLHENTLLGAGPERCPYQGDDGRHSAAGISPRQAL